MPKPQRNPITPNMLLAELPSRICSSLQASAETVSLDIKRILHEPNDDASHVYFPVSGVISLLTVLEDGSAVEIATVGNEGMADLGVYLDLESSSRWLVQVPGSALRVDASLLRRIAEESAEVRRVMHNYMLAMFVLVSQTAACNRRHPVEERCARWLLMTHDRVEGDSFPMTHEFLADMLGVRRPSVSIAMSILSKAGYLRYHRGQVDIIDRDGLEQATCECYRVLTQQFRERFPATHSR